MSQALSQLKQDLLHPLTDLQEVVLVFYTTPMWRTLANETCTNIYFIKRTKEIKELFDNLFAWNINDYFISSITMKITLPANGNDFNYQFIAPMYLTPNYPCGNTVKDFIELFIDKLGDNIIHL